MRSIFLVFSAVLLASTFALPHTRPLRLPIPIHKRSTFVKDGIVDLDALRSHLAYSEGKYLEGIATMEGNTDLSTPLSGHSLGRRTADTSTIPLTPASVPLMPEIIELWYGTISVGSPAVEFNVDFDTGSADLFLPALDCDSTCDQHTRYNPNASTSAVDLHRNFTLLYSDNSTVSGGQYTDTVTIAGLVAKNQTVGAASRYSTGFQAARFIPDGLIGMAFANISRFQSNPVVQTLIAQGQLHDPVFSFKLASSGSELYIGGINEALHAGQLTYTPVTKQGFWQINVDSISGNGKPITTNLSAVIDTGTTLIIGGADNVRQFYRDLNVNATDVGYGFYLVPCDATHNISFTIQGRTFNISADAFNLGPPDPSGNNCVGAVQGSQLAELADMWILGDVFLRNVYTVFDVGGLQVGFADLA